MAKSEHEEGNGVDTEVDVETTIEDMHSLVAGGIDVIERKLDVAQTIVAGLFHGGDLTAEILTESTFTDHRQNLVDGITGFASMLVDAVIEGEIEGLPEGE